MDKTSERQASLLLHIVMAGVDEWDIEKDSFLAGLYLALHLGQEAPDLLSGITTLLESNGFQALGFATPESMELKYRDVVSHAVEAARTV